MYRDSSKLPVGCVINMYAQEPPKSYPWFKRQIFSLAMKAIRAYQKSKYPQSDRVDAVHSMVHLGEGRVLDVTWPKAYIHKLELDPQKRYTFWLWRDAPQINAEAQFAMQRIAEEFAGREYDWLQLAGIGWQKVFAKILTHILPPPYNAEIGQILSLRTLLGLGRVRTVCSAGAHAVLLAAYKAMKRAGLDVERPLGDQWVEVTCPADFENHETFIELSHAA